MLLSSIRTAAEGLATDICGAKINKLIFLSIRRKHSEFRDEVGGGPTPHQLRRSVGAPVGADLRPCWELVPVQVAGSLADADFALFAGLL